MRATRAYIASLGTTGLLLAFSASLLVVVGTLFAFNAWPGAQTRDEVGSVILDEEEEPFRVAGPAQVALDAAPAALAVASAPAGASTGAAGGPPSSFAGGGTAPPGNGPGGGSVGGGGGAPTGGGGGDVTPTGGPPLDTGEGTNRLADSTEQVTTDVGKTVGGVNQDLGDTVSGTGQALSDIVRDLPDVKVGGGRLTVGN